MESILNKKINVLSLFDGMSCGQIALQDMGVDFNYYYSEIDKFAIEQTKLNFPNAKHLGDVNNCKNWGGQIDLSKIDLIIGGSPCQGFSFAGKMLAFDDPRSVLFFKFVEVVEMVKALNPNVKFLLENVDMRKKDIATINRYIGISPVKINSSLVSAQNRVRLYWSNIRTKKVGLFDELYTDIPQPKDENIYLNDILDIDVDSKYFLSEKMIKLLSKRPQKGFDRFSPKTTTYKGKSRALTARLHKMGASDNYIITHNLQPRTGKGVGGKGYLCKTDGKSYCLDTGCSTAVEYNNRIRRLTPNECSKLQTIPIWYKWNCSDTQKYKMLGNGWTVEVIKHIFKYL